MESQRVEQPLAKGGSFAPRCQLELTRPQGRQDFTLNFLGLLVPKLCLARVDLTNPKDSARRGLVYLARGCKSSSCSHRGVPIVPGPCGCRSRSRADVSQRSGERCGSSPPC